MSVREDLGGFDEAGLRERFELRSITSDEAFGMSRAPCFAEHGFPAGKTDRVPEVDPLTGLDRDAAMAVLGIVPAEERSTERLGLALSPPTVRETRAPVRQAI